MQPFIAEQARPLVRLVEARYRPTLIRRADLWVHEHTGTALILLVAAAFWVASIFGS